MAAYFVPDNFPAQVYFPDLTLREAATMTAVFMKKNMIFPLPLNGDEHSNHWRVINFGKLIGGTFTDVADLSGIETVHISGTADQLLQRLDPRG